MQPAHLRNSNVSRMSPHKYLHLVPKTSALQNKGLYKSLTDLSHQGCARLSPGSEPPQRWVSNIQCESKKGNPDLISNLRKTKIRITKLITGNASTIISLSYDTLVTHIILDNRWLLSNHFCKTCQNYFFSKFWVLARLSCVKGNPGLTQNFSKLKKDITKLISVW